jgi:hypothetical protein
MKKYIIILQIITIRCYSSLINISDDYSHAPIQSLSWKLGLSKKTTFTFFVKTRSCSDNGMVVCQSCQNIPQPLQIGIKFELCTGSSFNPLFFWPWLRTMGLSTLSDVPLALFSLFFYTGPRSKVFVGLFTSSPFTSLINPFTLSWGRHLEPSPWYFDLRPFSLFDLPTFSE